MQLIAGQHNVPFPGRRLVMGILNLGHDSFSGDGITNVEAAVVRGEQMLREGIDILDVGAESARTNRAAIPESEEADRLCDFVERWQRRPSGRVMLSINTWRPSVARQVLTIGGDLLNDVGGLPTDENARICADTGAALVIMHSVGAPKVPHTHVRYGDVMAELERFFEEKIRMATAAGLSEDAIVIDPGIDFAKQCADNLRIYRELEQLHRFQRPILLAVSRKTVVGDVLGITEARERDPGTVACVVQGMLQGAHVFRMHNVRAARQTIAAVEPLIASRD